MKIAVMGAAGRMGRELVRAIAAEPGCSVAGATEAAGSSLLGKDIGELAGLERMGVAVSSDAAAVIAAADAIVDFTVPKASVEFAQLAAKSGTPHIIGTTGFDAVSEAAIAEAATQHGDRQGRQHEPWRQSPCRSDTAGRCRARERLRYRNC